jgi:hypothetical protein
MMQAMAAAPVVLESYLASSDALAKEPAGTHGVFKVRLQTEAVSELKCLRSLD